MEKHFLGCSSSHLEMVVFSKNSQSFAISWKMAIFILVDGYPRNYFTILYVIVFLHFKEYHTFYDTPACLKWEATSKYIKLVMWEVERDSKEVCQEQMIHTTCLHELIILYDIPLSLQFKWSQIFLVIYLHDSEYTSEKWSVSNELKVSVGPKWWIMVIHLNDVE